MEETSKSEVLLLIPMLLILISKTILELELLNREVPKYIHHLLPLN